MGAKPRVSISQLKQVKEERGELVEIDFRSLPFEPKRLFYIYGVPSGARRGGHAHRECHQFLICVKGSVTLETDDGAERKGYVLDNPAIGLHLEPPVWLNLTDFSPDAVLMVFASHPYDPGDYVRDYDEFISYVKAR